jgi:hypothetical protein
LFVAELVRAANEVDRLSLWEVARLLERAISTVRELRETVGIPKDGTERDELVRLRTAGSRAREGLKSLDFSDALLVAAEMICTLHIIIDSDTEIETTKSPAPEVCGGPEPGTLCSMGPAESRSATLLRAPSARVLPG